MSLDISHRPPFQRFQYILRRLNAHPGELVSGSQFAVELEVNIKTIQRDIDFIRDRLGLPIETKVGRGYYLAESRPLCACCGGRV